MTYQQLASRLGAAMLAAALIIGCRDDRPTLLTAPSRPRLDVNPGDGSVTVTGIRDLGIPAGWESSIGQSINDAGTVAGFSTGNGYTGIPWRWQNGAFTMLPLPPTRNQARAYGINELGQVAGTGLGHDADRWESSGQAVTLLDTARATGLATASSINDEGTAAGRAWIDNYRNDPCCGWTTVWFATGERRQLSPFTSGHGGGADAINNLDVVAGWASGIFSGTTTSHAAVWNTDGIPVDLGVLPGGTTSEATAINDRGVVAGWGDVAGGIQAFVWANGVMTPLPFLDPGLKNCRALGINEYGHVVGYCQVSYTGSGTKIRPVLWRNGTAIDLGTLAGDISGQAFDVNNQGQITGISGPGGGDFIVGHAVIWSYTMAPADPLTPLPARRPVIASSAEPIIDEVFLNGPEIRHHFIDITNAGSGLLDLLAVGPSFVWGDHSGNGSTGWVVPVLNQPLAPARLDLVITDVSPPADQLYTEGAPGVFTVRIPIVSTAIGVPNSPYYINVRKRVGLDDAWRLFSPAAQPVFVALRGGSAPAAFNTLVNTAAFPFCGGAIQLSIGEIRYPAWEPSGWLTGSVNGFELTLQANQASLATGEYTANITLAMSGGPSTCGPRNYASSFSVTLRVVDNLPNRPPVVNLGGPYTASEASPVPFTTSATDPDGDALTLTYDLGDGTAGNGLPPATHTYADNGVYTVRVTAFDGRSTTTSTATVTVNNVAPTATMSVQDFLPANANYGFTMFGTDVSFVDRGSLQYAFDCGGGFGPFSSNSTSACVAPAFGQANVRATVKDKDGDAFTLSATIPVRNVMDVQPNTISLSATGTVSVYLYSTPGFDATQSSAATTRLRVVGSTQPGASVLLRGTSFTTSVGDYNGDGRPDRLFVFARSALQAAGLSTSNTALILEDVTGTLRFQAVDAMPPTIVP